MTNLTPTPAPTTGLHIDWRTTIEAAVSALVVIILGINNVGLDETTELAASLALLALVTFLSRLLGKSGTDAINEMRESMDAWMAQMGARYAVLAANANPAELRRAEEAAVAAGATPVDNPPPVA